MAELSRTIWKGELITGLYTIPVKLYSAARDVNVHFNLLDEKDNTRLVQQMYCPEDEEPVERVHIIKGYEISEGNYVEVSKEELDSIVPKTSKKIEIIKFVKEAEIDLRYLKKYYYLGSDDSEEAYTALTSALKNKKSAAFCKWTMRKKRYMGIIKQYHGILSLITLRGADEVKGTEIAAPKETHANQKEVEIAMQLIEALASEFEPGHYDNEYQAKLKALIEKKAKGKRIVKRKMPKMESTKTTDLIKTLQKSLDYVNKQKQKG